MDAAEKLRTHINTLFENAPATRAAFELKEELLSNSLERYEDLIAGGMPFEEALENVIESIGNVDDLIAALPDEEPRPGPELEQARRVATARTTAIAVGLYIFAAIVLIASPFFPSTGNFDSTVLGLIVALFICIIPTCMLVYNAKRWPSYKKQEDTVVESFKQWNSETQKVKSLRGAISSLIWTVTLAAYFIISFLTMAWYITWVMFLIAAFLEALTTLIFRFKELG